LKLATRNIALTAIFAALYYVLSLVLPSLYAIGVPNLQIKLEALIASVFGLVLGPYLGALAALLGVCVAWVLPPSGLNPYGVPFLLSPPLNALVVGLVYYRKWKWAFALFALLIGTFMFLPPSQPIAENYIVPVAALWDKVIALLLIIPTVVFSQRLSDTKRLPILFFFICFVGNQVDNMWGNNVFAVPYVYQLFGLSLDATRVAFIVSPFFYPAVRFVQAILGTIIAVPLMKALKNSKWIIKEKSIIEL
jgi:biotin transporter BioY